MKLRIAIHGVLDVTYERESKLTEYAMLDKDVVMHVKALVTHTVDEALRLQAPAERMEQQVEAELKQPTPTP